MRTMVLDVGGTAIKSAVYDPDVKENYGLLDIAETPTQAHLGGEHVVETILSVIKETRKKHDFCRIGISTAGEVDPEAGVIIHANENIPGYTGTPLAKIVSEAFSMPVRVENDVNAAAIGEAAFGAGKDMSDFICLTYGTGVGGALFLNGNLFHGSSFSAGAFGAIVVHPEDRDPEKDMYLGGYEKYAAATALVKKAKAMDPSLTDGRKIFERLHEPAVKALVDEWTDEIIYGLVSIVHMMNPSCLILGGGIMEQSYVTESVRSKLMKNIMPDFRNVQVRKAALGNRAGLLGAASLFQKEG
ncbi:MAG: ROK family protein [Lachnospiraceae bacterium]|nr:ROK family protein [Lachnospiraceae bacterium]